MGERGSALKAIQRGGNRALDRRVYRQLKKKKKTLPKTQANTVTFAATHWGNADVKDRQILRLGVLH